MKIEDCFRLRLLIKIEPDIEKAKSDLTTAESKLLRAKELMDSGFYSDAVLSAYTSMFHSARVLLYKDGIQEKSHYAVYIYLEEKYSSIIPRSLLNSFLAYQKERHNILYGFSYEEKFEDVELIIIDAEEFLMKIKDILNL